MLKPWKKTTYQDAISHAEAVIAEIQADPAFVEVSERAQVLGVTLEFGYRHTLNDEHRGALLPDFDVNHTVPMGYVMELWLDLCDAKHVLASTGDEESRVQYSISGNVCEYVEGFFSSKIDMLETDAVMKNGFPLVMLEEFLDAIEENGCMPSPFGRDSLVPDEPMGELDPHTDMSQLAGGSYVVMIPGAYDGFVENKGGIYIGEHAFLPYKYLLLGVVSLERFNDAKESLTLTSEEGYRFAELMRELKGIEESQSYTDTFNSGCGIAAYAPPPNLEFLLDTITTQRYYDFEDNTKMIIAWLEDVLETAQSITIVW